MRLGRPIVRLGLLVSLSESVDRKSPELPYYFNAQGIAISLTNPVCPTSFYGSGITRPRSNSRRYLVQISPYGSCSVLVNFRFKSKIVAVCGPPAGSTISDRSHWTDYAFVSDEKTAVVDLPSAVGGFVINVVAVPW